MDPSEMVDSKPQKRTFHDLIRQALEKPQVHLIVDLVDNHSEDMLNMFGGIDGLNRALNRYARTFGALVHTVVFDPPSEDMLVQAIAYVQRLHKSVVIIAGTNQAMQNRIAKNAAAGGNVVILLGRAARSEAVVVQHDLVFYMSLSKLSHGGDRLDIENYDFEPFIRLLLTSEQKMPFVGVGYFINSVMWRLGPAHADPSACQEVFQAAREREVVCITKSDNVNPNALPVSSCTANREHPLVQKVLHDVASGNALEEAAQDGV